MGSILGSEIFLSILVFTLAVNAMVLIILGARKVLVSSGDITIEMNENPERSIVVQAGGKLLQTLANQNLFLSIHHFPSFCSRAVWIKWQSHLNI